MELKLIVRSGKMQGQTLVVRQGESTSLGRGTRSDVQIFDEGLSRLHCRIEGRDGKFLISDLDSSNGTYVNAEPIKTVYLHHGDRIQVGLTIIDCSVECADHPEGDEPGQTTLGFVSGDEQTMPQPRVRRKAAADRSDFMSALAGTGAGAEVTDLERFHRILTTLYRVGNTINSETSLDALYRTIVDSILEATQADEVALLMLRPGTESSADNVEIAAAARRGSEKEEKKKEKESSPLTISRTVLDDVLKQGLMTLSQDAQDDERYRSGQSIIMGNIRSVMCAPVQAQEEILGAIYVDSRRLAGAFNEDDLELLATLGVQAGIAIHRVRLLDSLENLFFGTVRALAATVDAKDGYTHNHSERVAAFAVRIAKELGLDEREREKIQLAALLHDIGKIGIHDLVLNKNGRLTEEEYAEMKLHPVCGADILRNIQHEDVSDLIPGVLHHHERWDGTGYPDGLAGEATPLIARIIGVADALDAMTSDRSYRKALGNEKAAAEIRRCSGTQFEPQIAEAALRLHERGDLTLPQRLALRYAGLSSASGSALPAAESPDENSAAPPDENSAAPPDGNSAAPPDENSADEVDHAPAGVRKMPSPPALPPFTPAGTDG